MTISIRISCKSWLVSGGYQPSCVWLNLQIGALIYFPTITPHKEPTARASQVLGNWALWVHGLLLQHCSNLNSQEARKLSLHFWVTLCEIGIWDSCSKMCCRSSKKWMSMLNGSLATWDILWDASRLPTLRWTTTSTNASHDMQFCTKIGFQILRYTIDQDLIHSQNRDPFNVFCKNWTQMSFLQSSWNCLTLK